MGLFDFPRIHVYGNHEVNPGTGNNNSASPGDELTVTSDSEAVQPIEKDQSDAEFRRWMSGLDELGVLRSQWNYYGDMSFRFLDVTVRSVQLTPDLIARSDKEDPLVGASVHLNNAIVCDNNPEGFNGTQVFAEALEIHAPNAIETPGSFVSRPPDRATTRWLNWERNVSFHTPFAMPNPVEPPKGEITSGAAGGASATFQCGIEVAPDDLEKDRGDERLLARSRFKLLPLRAADGVKESAALAALIQAIRDGARGILFRYNLYLTYPRISDTELARRFAAGERPINPARGKIIGTITPWYAGEPSTVTLGRLLRPAAAYPTRHRPAKQYFLSPAVAAVNRKARRIAIDLANCLPEHGPEGEKYDLGEISLGVRPATKPDADPATNTGDVEPLGTIENTRESYLERGGIYDIEYRADQSKLVDDENYELVLSSSKHGVLSYEPEYMLASDCTCNYLDELGPGEGWRDAQVLQQLQRQPHAALRGAVDLHLLRRGKKSTEPVSIRVEEWQQTPTGDPASYGKYLDPKLLSTRTLWVREPVALFELAPSPGRGLRMYRFVPDGQWPQHMDGKTFARQAIREATVELRVLPHDAYDVKDEQLTLEFIYQQVFRYYDLITPAMSVAMDLKDPTIWQTPTAARYLLLTTSLELWGSWQFMPRTRDLSHSRRELLRRYCQLVLTRHNQTLE